DACANAVDKPCGFQGVAPDSPVAIEPAGIDSLLQSAQIYHRMLLPKDVVEAALGKTAMQRHLPAFKAFDSHAGPCCLSLPATAGGFSLAVADAAAHPNAVLPGTRIVGKL